MALEASDIEAIAGLIKKEVASVVGEHVESAVAEATTPKPQTNDETQNQLQNQPDYYVHLANGDVITSKDSQSTHMDVDGVSVAVIGRYPVGA